MKRLSTDRGGPAGFGFDGGARGDRGQEQHDGRSRAAVRAEHGHERQPEGAERRRREPQSESDASPENKAVSPSPPVPEPPRHSPPSPVPANVEVDVNPTQPVTPSRAAQRPGGQAAGAGHHREHGGHQRRGAGARHSGRPLGGRSIPRCRSRPTRSSTPGSRAWAPASWWAAASRTSRTTRCRT